MIKFVLYLQGLQNCHFLLLFNAGHSFICAGCISSQPSRPPKTKVDTRSSAPCEGAEPNPLHCVSGSLPVQMASAVLPRGETLFKSCSEKYILFPRLFWFLNVFKLLTSMPNSPGFCGETEILRTLPRRRARASQRGGAWNPCRQVRSRGLRVGDPLTGAQCLCPHPPRPGGPLPAHSLTPWSQPRSPSAFSLCFDHCGLTNKETFRLGLEKIWDLPPGQHFRPCTTCIQSSASLPSFLAGPGMAGPLASAPVGSRSLLMCQWAYLGQGERRTLPCSLLEGAAGKRDLPAVSKHSDKNAQHTAPPLSLRPALPLQQWE